MYKATVRWMIRRNIARLNAGDHGPALAMYADDLEFVVPRGQLLGIGVHALRQRAASPRDAPRGRRDGALPPALRGGRDPDGGRGHPRQRAAVEHAGGRPGPRVVPRWVGRPLRQPGRPVRHRGVGEAAHARGLRGHRAVGRVRRPPRERSSSRRAGRRSRLTGSHRLRPHDACAAAGCAGSMPPRGTATRRRRGAPAAAVPPCRRRRARPRPSRARTG